MKTMQGIEYRRRAVAGAFARMAAYTLAFVLLVAAARVLVWPTLAGWMADATSVWIEVPADSVDLYRMLGYQEGSLVNGNPQFRDLADYRFVTGIIKGPVLWSAYAIGLAAVGLWCAARSTRGVDALMAALEQAAAGGKPELPGGFDGARAAFARLAEREQAQARAATYAEARKNELVAYLAHDIKTPLTSVIGYLALLAEEPGLPTARRERYARSALEKAQRFDGMMDEFFEITRYNLGAIPIERETTDVALLVEQVADELYPAAMERGVRIEVEVPEGLSAFIDPEKMARVMGNLLKNGIAYAEAGTAVVCRARVDEAAGDATAASEGGAVGDVIAAGGSNAAGRGSAAGDGSVEGARLVLTVEDTGKEISAAHLDRIFDKFYREDGARSGKGAGLGLAIAREIVEAHGGAIDASSERGVTTFTVRVPA